MWPFKKIEVKVDAPLMVNEKPKTYKVKTLQFGEPVDFDIGYTNVKVDFLDGRSLVIRVYGVYYPISYAHKFNYQTKQFEDAKIYKTEFYDSLSRARQLKQQYAWVDDPKNVKNTVFGQVTEFTIQESFPYLEKVPNPILVEKELEVPNDK